QRNLAIARGEDIVYDLTKIEAELANILFLLCFVKRTAVRDKDISIKDYISKWVKLSSLSTHEGFARFLNIDLRLKHLVALYEFVEEQVADVKIKYIHEKYKEELSTDMKAAIMNSVDFKKQTTMKIAIPAEAFSLALKRFMFRFLTLENQKEMEPLYVYLQD
ncbi:22160_t:CDS:2, partial [Rhizophagus irregularis]